MDVCIPIMEEAVEMVTEIVERDRVTQPRAYQLELFEESMKRNVIVTVRISSMMCPRMMS